MNETHQRLQRRLAAIRDELSEHVRQALNEYVPTLSVGDRLGTFGIDEALLSFTVCDVADIAFLNAKEAEQLAAKMSERQEWIAVVRYDRVYNIVRFDQRIDSGIVTDCNLQLELNSRFTTAHAALDALAPRITSLALSGQTIHTAMARATTVDPPESELAGELIDLVYRQRLKSVENYPGMTIVSPA